jgi:hypothetical protein
MRAGASSAARSLPMLPSEMFWGTPIRGRPARDARPALLVLFAKTSCEDQNADW